MWPWEHLVFGYLLYSGALRITGRGRPGARPTLALALATQVPDLVDKPLGWVFAVVPAGRALGHSLFFAALLVGLTALAARRFGLPGTPGAVAVGLGSHLVGDALVPTLLGKPLSLAFLLWPLLPVPPGTVDGVLPHVWSLWTRYWAFLTTGRGGLFLAVEVAFLALGAAVWALDGYPGVPRRWRDRAET